MVGQFQFGDFAHFPIGANTSAPMARNTFSVHPHVRGDGLLLAPVIRHTAGSPPRAWGRRLPQVRSHTRPRFTPTCVGTASAGVRPGVSAAVHPHVRGDGTAAIHSLLRISGSPPRAWGRRLGVALDVGSGRFTPTCVGTARECSDGCFPMPVHPHVRGDGSPRYGNFRATAGSPPRAWGRLGLVRFRVVNLRFTPTCVGTATTAAFAPCAPTVHPHVRGDGCGTTTSTKRRHGSPPRAWGRRRRPRPRNARQRFTPTCVGTASTPWLQSRLRSVHPHVRGDGSTTD